MDSDSLKYFVAVAEAANMSRAAEILHVSQPTLTVSIRKLEEQLNVTLFERSKKGVTLTSSGKEIYTHSKHILSSFESMAQAAASTKTEVKGLIRLGAHASVAAYTLPKLLKRFLGDHPHAGVHLTHDLSRNILHSVQAHELDVAFVINPVRHPDLVIKEISTDEVTIWKRKSAKASDVLFLDSNLSQTQWILKKLEAKKITYARKIESASLEVIAKCLDAGVGHAILPRRVALNDSDLVEAHPQITPYKDSLCLVYRPAFKSSALGRAFIDTVLHECRVDPVS